MKKPASTGEITEESLRKSALSYLKTRDTTTEGLRQVLHRKLRRLRLSDEEIEGLTGAIDRVVNACVEAGYVDDRRFTLRQAEIGQETGRSARKIRAKLATKGVDPDLVSSTLSEVHDDLQAALTFARKKRIGLFRVSERRSFLDKDMGKLARQGYSYEICRKIVEAEDETEISE